MYCADARELFLARYGFHEKINSYFFSTVPTAVSTLGLLTAQQCEGDRSNGLDEEVSHKYHHTGQNRSSYSLSEVLTQNTQSVLSLRSRT